MLPPSMAQVPTKGGTSLATPGSAATTPSTAHSYSVVVSKTAFTSPRVNPVPLANQLVTYVDNIPVIILTLVEED